MIFTASFFLHLLLWKIRLPGRQVKTLLGIHFGGLLVALACLAQLPPGNGLMGVHRPAGAAEFAHVCLLVTALILAYMITYTAVEADSPSLLMVLKIQAAGPNGIGKDAFEAFFTDERLVLPRIKDLLTDKMAELEGGRYRLTPKVKLLAEIFIAYRSILGLGMGG